MSRLGKYIDKGNLWFPRQKRRWNKKKKRTGLIKLQPYMYQAAQ